MNENARIDQTMQIFLDSVRDLMNRRCVNTVLNSHEYTAHTPGVILSMSSWMFEKSIASWVFTPPANRIRDCLMIHGKRRISPGCTAYK